jgi:signal peptide peptidase SppA
MRAQVAEYIEETPWAILPSRLRQWVAALASEEPDEQIRARFEGGQRQAMPAALGVGVIPIVGPISPRPTLLELLFGYGTSTSSVGAQVKALVADPSVKAIVLDVDSPGGSVFGVQELAEVILAAREVKPVIAVANHLMASAAYWIGAAASEVVAAPSAMVGSVGVVVVHMDESKMLEKIGVKPTFVTAGKYKAEGDPAQPLSEDAKARLQEMVDQYYAAFTGGVARGRGVPVAQVRTQYGQGRLLTAREGLAAGMIDRIATLDETLGRVPLREARPGRACARGAAADRRRGVVLRARGPRPTAPAGQGSMRRCLTTRIRQAHALPVT